MNNKTEKYRPFPVDVWALGVILFQLFNRDFPFRVSKGKKYEESCEEYEEQVLSVLDKYETTGQ